MGFSGGGTGGGGTSFIPIGGILIYGGQTATPPSGFVGCNGQAISRTTFANLFDVIGTQYGVGDGSTTFNVPDFRTNESFPRGALNDGARGTEGGESEVTLATGEMPIHTHIQNSHTHVYTGIGSVGNGFGGEAGLQTTGLTTGATTAVNQDAGNDEAHENKPPFVDCNYIIKV